MNPVQLNPYADWEREMRPSIKAEPPTPSTKWPECLVEAGTNELTRLQPVFVEITRKVGETANDIARRIARIIANAVNCEEPKKEFGFYLLDALTRNNLGRLKDALQANQPDHILERYTRFFLFRLERDAYEDADDFRVIHVCPAFPATVVYQFIYPELGSDEAASIEAPPQTPRGGRAPVLTGIIDDYIGLANSRFCRLEAGKRVTRIEKIWINETAIRLGDESRIFNGHTLTKSEINKLIEESTFGDKLDETHLYEQVYPGGQLRFIGDRDEEVLQRRLASVTAVLAARAQPAQELTLEILTALFERTSSMNPKIYLDPGAKRPVDYSVSHGTHILDLAAGFPMEHAPVDRPIFAVQLPSLASAETSGYRLDHSVLSGVMRLLNWADDWSTGPAEMVINLSYMVQAGPKNGSGFLETEIKRIIDLRNKAGHMTKIVLPSGNGYRRKSRAERNLPKGSDLTIAWRIPPCDQSSNFLEIFHDNGDVLEAELVTPDGTPWPLASAANPMTELKLRRNGVDITVGRSYYSLRGKSGNITVALAPTIFHHNPSKTAPAGRYDLKLTNVGGAVASIEVEVQRDDTPRNYPETGYQSYLDAPDAYGFDRETHNYQSTDGADVATRLGTLSALASIPRETDEANRHVIVVGGAIDRDALTKASLYAASGPAPEGRREPDLSAVSDETRTHRGRLASGTKSGSTATVQGTSVACALVTRALVDDPTLSSFGTKVLTEDAPRLGDKLKTFDAGPGRPMRRERSP